MAAIPKTLVDWLKAVHAAPGSNPPLPEGFDLRSLESGDWIKRQGDGWQPTPVAVRLLQLGKRK